MKLSSLLALMALIATPVDGVDPPKIVSASPDFWAANVNSTLKTVTLAFDQPMRAGFSDWFGKGVLVPDSNSKTATSDDRRTFSLDVNLKPGSVYILGLNERGLSGVGFQNEKASSLQPAFLVFQTAGTPAPADSPPAVVGTIPTNGALQVDPSKTKTVTIIFDRPMDPKKHGLQLYENKNAVDVTSAKFQYSADGRTFVISYDFKSSTPYEVVLNSVQNIGFTSATSIPLWPVRMSFSTSQPQ